MQNMAIPRPSPLDGTLRAALFVVVVLSISSTSLSRQNLNAEEPQRIEITDFIPYGREPINYFNAPPDDAVSRLQSRLTRKAAELHGDSPQGYLLSVLNELKVPLSSQVLVFSKTARHPDLIGPKNPRAIYFNDEVAVAWVPEALELEITASDPIKGINFYTLRQPAKTDSTAASPPQFERRDQCLACHAGRSTLEIPGLLLRAFQTDASGKPVMGYSILNHETPYEKRWGGWFVVGTPPGFGHRGNLTSTSDNDRDKLEPNFRASLANLNGITRIGDYATSSSDVIAHLVLAHQTYGLNLIVRVGTESRYRRRSDAEDKLLRYLVFEDEPPLPKPLNPEAIQHSRYREYFENQSPNDSDGRSLRQFDLKTRVFRHRLSYLIEHPLFLQLPTECRDRLYDRLRSGFRDSPTPSGFKHLSDHERATLDELLTGIIARSTSSRARAWNEGTPRNVIGPSIPRQQASLVD